MARIREARGAKSTSLNLSGLQLDSLPKSVGQLVNIKTLVVSTNQLTELPESLSRLSSLDTVVLAENRLASLPDWLGSLTRLRRLDLSSNKLSSFPASFGDLSELRELYLGHNQFSSLSEALRPLKGLSTLSLGGNQLTSLPDWVGDLDGLEVLDLRDNRLTFLPESLLQLKKLRQLLLDGNTDLNIPDQILGASPGDVARSSHRAADPKAILEYHLRSRRQGRALREARLILLGNGGAGKTSLVRRLTLGEFDAARELTHAIKITSLKLKVEDEEALLHIWDFGGQEIDHAIYRIFLVPQSLYLVVLNAHHGNVNDEAETWLQQVAALGNDPPVVVVVNQADRGRFQLKTHDLQSKYPNIRDFLTTDCASGLGLDTLRNTLTSVLKAWPPVKIPAPWDRIRWHLKNMTDRFLPVEQFRQLCRNDGVEDEAEQDRIAATFNSLGIILNINDDPRLRDTMVVEPSWLTGGIFRILNDQGVIEHEGVVSVDDLSRILAADFPRRCHVFLLDLLRHFELAFPFSEDGRTFLIPQMLGIEEPPGLDKFSTDRCLSFEYVYNVPPAGFLLRFIVRTRALSEGRARRRKMVVVGFESCEALVRADTAEHKILIQISGPMPDRRRFLDIIRAEFDRIHTTIAGLQVEERLPVPGRPRLRVSYRDVTSLSSKGQRTITVVDGDEVVELEVASLLEGVPPEGRRGRLGGGTESAGPLRVYCSYSRKDKRLLNELLIHLTTLERQGLITIWSDRDLKPAEPWEEQLREELERADIYLLLVSADYLASDFIYSVEIPQAIKRHDAGQAVVIPVILRPVDWLATPLAQFQALPQNARPLTQWPNRDAAWANVAEGIRRAVDFRRRGNARPRKRTLRVARVELENVRCFERLNLDLGREAPPRLFTLVFGENGVGKSTILRSLALALCSETKAAALIERLKGSMIRNGAPEARVNVDLVDPESGGQWTVNTMLSVKNGALMLRRETSEDFPGGEVFVCGYGAGRRGLALGEPSSDYEIDTAVLSLFDYQAPLQNPELVLRRLGAERGSLNEMLLKLDVALSLEFGSTALDSSGIRIKGPWGDFIPAGALGDGYQATLAWIVDFLGWQAMFDRECPLADISGVVLVDEIEQHLHPKWQREIVQQLAKDFPNVQFLITSHSPVCAGGLADLEEGRGKLFVLENAGGRIAVKDVPPPAGMRYDQIMTSEVIGLEVARDKTTESLLEEIRSAFEEPGHLPGQSPRFAAAMERLRDRSVTAAEDEDTRLTQRRLATELTEIRRMMSSTPATDPTP
jgi:internalin A